jgi:hypothetical protein
MLQGLQISYRGKNYRVQDANGWKHIIVTTDKIKKRIGIAEIIKEQENDCVFDYIFAGGFTTHPCPAMDYWIYRHRMGNKISTSSYKIKFKIKWRANQKLNGQTAPGTR